MILILRRGHAGRALEVAHARLELRAAFEARDQTAPGAHVFRGKGARVYARACERVADRRVAAHHHVVADLQVSGNSHRTTNHAALADGDAAGDTGAPGDRGVRADAHVVPDLD